MRLRAIREGVKPEGRAIVNVLIEGTTYMDMFDPDGYCLVKFHRENFRSFARKLRTIISTF